MIVGLAGYARSGKDTAAQALCRHRGFKRVAFADKVRELSYATDGCVRHLVDSYGWDGAKEFPYVRGKLQEVGAAARTVIGPEVWIDAALRATTLDDIVVTDVRYSNEARTIRAREGIVLRIVRPGHGPVNGHISETDLDDFAFDAVIRNDFTEDALHAKILFAADAAR